MHDLNSARFRLPIPEVHASSMLTNISFDGIGRKENLGTDILACLDILTAYGVCHTLHLDHTNPLNLSRGLDARMWD